MMSDLPRNTRELHQGPGGAMHASVGRLTVNGATIANGEARVETAIENGRFVVKGIDRAWCSAADPADYLRLARELVRKGIASETGGWQAGEIWHTPEGFVAELFPVGVHDYLRTNGLNIPEPYPTNPSRNKSLAPGSDGPRGTRSRRHTGISL